MNFFWKFATNGSDLVILLTTKPLWVFEQRKFCVPSFFQKLLSMHACKIVLVRSQLFGSHFLWRVSDLSSSLSHGTFSGTFSLHIIKCHTSTSAQFFFSFPRKDPRPNLPWASEVNKHLRTTPLRSTPATLSCPPFPGSPLPPAPLVPCRHCCRRHYHHCKRLPASGGRHWPQQQLVSPLTEAALRASQRRGGRVTRVLSEIVK